MNTKFYYIRDNNNAPIITVCLVEENKIVARGIALCSYKDHPSKKEGRRMAKGRALRAFFSRRTSQPISRKEVEIFISCFDSEFPPTKYKSEFMPSLTSFEKKILGKDCEDATYWSHPLS